MTPAQWAEVIDTNLTGVFNACHAAMPHLRKRGGGFIINISSLAGKNPFAGARRVLRVEGRPERVQRSADAGSPIRQHPRQLRHARIGRHRLLERRRDEGRRLEDRPRTKSPTSSQSAPHDPRSLPSRVELRPSKPQK